MSQKTEQNSTSAGSTESPETPSLQAPPVVHESTIVQIQASLEQLEEHAKKFKELKTKLLTDDDYAIINDKKYIKKSGWFTFAFAFNLKTHIISETKETDPMKPLWYAYHFTVRCEATNGRITEKVGSCDTIEKPSTSMHVIRAMAETRATNRAISAMVGGGEPSAEEMNGKNTIKTPTKFCECKETMTMNDGKCKTCGLYSKLWWDNHGKTML